MSENKRNSRNSGKGYYIALILCAAAIGITSYVYQRNSNAAQQASLQETIPSTVPVQIQQTEDVPVLATTPKEPTAAPTVPPVTAPAVEKSLKTGAPVSGEEIMGYSMEALSYNQTTRDWRVHDGVDIAADSGTPVLAAADGTVSSVHEDDTLGYTVTIRHTGGYVTQYSSLAENIPVETGDVVTMGAIIGYVGETALVESTLGTHVHFRVTHNEEAMDPGAFLALGQ